MPEPRYVQGDPVSGEILGHFANPQSYATEAVPPDHPDILKWNAKMTRAGPPGILNRINALEMEIAKLRAEAVAGLNRAGSLFAEARGTTRTPATEAPSQSGT